MHDENNKIQRKNLKNWILVFVKNFLAIFLVLAPLFLYLGTCYLIQKYTSLDKLPYVHWNGLDPANSVYVSWETSKPTSTYIKYGKDLNLNDGIYQDDTLSNMHHIKLEGLEPNTQYFFKAGSSSDNLFDKIFYFYTAPQPNSNVSFNFTVISDTQQFMGTGHYDRIASAIADARHGDAAFVLFAGDMGQEPYDQETWNFFMHQTQKYSYKIPIVPCMGNHDKNGFNIDTMYHKYFGVSLFNSSSSHPNKNYYAFNWSNTLFVIMEIAEGEDTNPLIEYSIEQDQWLNNTLKDAQSQDYRILIFHRPIYSGAGCSQTLINRLVPIIKTYNVSMVFYGHEHIYERFFIDNVTYVNVAGGGGMQNVGYYPIEGLQKVAMGPFFTRVFINSTNVILRTYSPRFNIIDEVELIKIDSNLILKEVD